MLVVNLKCKGIITETSEWLIISQDYTTIRL